MSRILRIPTDETEIRVTINNWSKRNDITNFDLDAIFNGDAVELIIKTLDTDDMTTIFNFYDYLDGRSLHITTVEIELRDNNKIFELISFLKKRDYRHNLEIWHPRLISDFEKSMQSIPPNLKKLILLGRPDSVDIVDMPNTVLDIRGFNEFGDIVDFLERNVKKIRYLKLSGFFIESPQRFCEIITESKIKYLSLFECGDETEVVPYDYVFYASFEFQQMLAEMIKNSTNLLDINID